MTRPGRTSQTARLLRALHRAGGEARLGSWHQDDNRVRLAHPLRTRVNIVAGFRAMREGWIEMHQDGPAVFWRLTERGRQVVEALEDAA